ncbi:MAG: Sir2 family NAD-dependent protein deacetylase [Chloroflexi bacterium]|nr:Sir2 family NAD-dependent protein deacetylase [Chloroflexota bacterium]
MAALLAGATRIVAFTGAGMSTESGIPDFRSPGGVWDRNKPIEYAQFLAHSEARRETWRRGLETYPVVAAAVPNAGHLALVELERRGQLLAVVTQNIDGLHVKAGHQRQSVIELHGNAHSVRCLSCDMEAARTLVHRRVLAGEAEPACVDCGGILKPTTISFGEPMPRRPLTAAERAIRASDLVLVIGSSLVVRPAADLPLLATRLGKPVVILNQTPTPLDDRATLVVRAKAAEILPAAVALAAAPA